MTPIYTAQKALTLRAAELSPSWNTALALRVRHLFWLKFAGVTVVTSGFMAGYFYVLRNPWSLPTKMPLTALDAAIPLQPPMMLVYLSLWLYVGVAPGLELRLRDLLVYAAWMSAMCLCGLLIFLLWPTQAPLPIPTGVNFIGFALVKGIDTPANACPSMHVAAAVFTAIRIHDTLQRIQTPPWLPAINALWCACILYSTLAVKQHVVLDILGGAMLAMTFASLSLNWRPPPARHTTAGPTS